ncbi:MAG: AgmX/PglI C-terminal domain-containing protein [Myxococcota bacterium]
MASPTRQAKVLRIGIIQDGKIVQEQLVKAGESVTVGEGENNTFVFPKTKLQSPEFLLFEWRDNHYALRFNERMRGKVSSGGAPVGLEKFRKDPAVEQSGDAWMLPLTEQDKGKLSIAPVTVLFQFVAPPPVQAVKPFEAMDFRPRLLDDDDPILLGFLGMWTALAVLFVAVVWNTELPEPSLEDIPDRFAQIQIAAPEPDAPETKTDEVKKDEVKKDEQKSEETVAAEKPVEKPVEPPKAKPKETEAQRAERLEAQKKELMAESALFTKLIGTTGEGRGTVSIDAAAGASSEDLAAKLREAAKGGAVVSSSGMRSGSASGEVGDRDIGGVGKGGGDGVVSAGPGPAVSAPEGKVSYSEPEFDGGESSGVNKVVRRYRGQLKHCYDQALKAKPDLAGRVVIAWSIISEAAADVFIEQNTTGDEAMGRCMVNKVKRWKFAGVDDGDAKVPFVFEPQ